MSQAAKVVDGIGGENSALRYEFGKALTEITGAARAMRVLAEYLDRHPEALLRGKTDK
jgi:paraquat-inducible protein B